MAFRSNIWTSSNGREPNISLQRAPSFGIHDVKAEPKNQDNPTSERDAAASRGPAFLKSSSKKPSLRDNDRQQLRGITDYHLDTAENLFAVDETRSVSEIFQDSNVDKLSRMGFGGKNIFDQILEVLAYELKEKPALVRNPPPRVREFVQCLVVRYPQLLRPPRNEGTQTRLLERLLKKCKPLAFDIISLLVSEEDKQAFEEPCPYQIDRSLGAAEECPLSQFYLPKALQNEFGKSQEQWRCLHERVDRQRFGSWVQVYRNTVTEAIELPSEQRDGYETWLHLMLEDQAAFTTTRPTPEIASFHKSFLSLIRLCPNTDPQKNVLTFCDIDGYTPLHRAINIFRSSDVDYALLKEAIEVLVHRCPESIYMNAKSKDSTRKALTPYRLLKELPKGPEARLKSIESVSRLLKHVCIRSKKTKTEKQKYLNESLADAPEIHLDLATVKGPGKMYMDARAEKVKAQLDSALEYVSLPQYQMDESGSSEESSRSRLPKMPPQHEKTIRETCDYYVAIFEWLLANGVNKIFRVSVEDRKSGITPHTDDAICKCLQPFDVEIWDWRKYDISSQTILKGAKNARELYLYWSGNQAIMQSWACKRGLAQLKQVQSITIVLSEMVMEPEKDSSDAFNDFKRRFCRRRKDVPETNIRLKMSRRRNGPLMSAIEVGERGSTNGHLASEPVWIRKMQEVIDTLKLMEVPRNKVVKIALIDKGVDRENPEVLAIERGQSFYHSGRITKGESWDTNFKEWDARPPIHGTQMAICIQKVCPMARLYVARMDDSNSDAQEFTLDSAIKAVKWAQEMGVDIISMSWSFKAKGDGYSPGEVESFKNTIADAKAKNILLFASLNDAEAAIIDNYYPCGLTDVFKIGSATKWGDKAAHSRSGADFILPGKDIRLPDVDDQTREVSGSSIATAFAAGLAGLVLYALTAHTLVNDEVDETIKIERLKQARSREGMNTIFNILSGNRHGAKKDVWVSLDDKFPDKIDKGNPDTDLKDFVQSICPKS